MSSSTSPFDIHSWTAARRAWAASRQDQWLDFQKALPAVGGPARFDFSDAQLWRHLGESAPQGLSHLGVGSTPRAAQLLDYQRRGIPLGPTNGREMERWGWAPETDHLRDALWASTLTPKQARRLAQEAVSHDPAPWVLWASAAPSAEALIDALLELGYRQPAMPPLGLLQLPFALGLAGAPFSSWARSCCALLDASSACDTLGELGAHCLYTPIQRLREKKEPSADPAVTDWSYAESASFSFMALFWREISQRPQYGDLALAAESDYAKATLGPTAAGLPSTARAEWPLPRAILNEPYKVFNSQTARLLEIGADANALTLSGDPCWWSAAKPDSEQGSEGYFSMMTPEIYQAFFDAGANFSIPVSPQYPDKTPTPMDQAYQRDLRSGDRAAIALAGEWVQRSAVRAQAIELDASLPPGLKASRVNL